LAYWIGVQGPSKLVKKTKTLPLCEPLPGEPLTQIKTIFFNRTKKTCRIRRGFEQLSSYSGWRVITKKTRANLLARAVVKGFVLHLPQLLGILLQKPSDRYETHQEYCRVRLKSMLLPLFLLEENFSLFFPDVKLTGFV